MNFEQLLITAVGLWPWGVVKLFSLVLLLFYIIFSAIAFRQIDLMSRMVEAQVTPVLRLIGLVNLGASLGLFLLALFIL